MFELAAVIGMLFVAVLAAKVVLVVGAVWFTVTYAIYILVMKLDEWRNDADNLVAEVLFTALLLPLVLVGWPLDVGFNWTYGLALGVTPDATLSSKLQYIRRVARGERPDVYGIVRPWRAAVANFICERLLNPFERDGHC